MCDIVGHSCRALESVAALSRLSSLRCIQEVLRMTEPQSTTSASAPTIPSSRPQRYHRAVLGERAELRFHAECLTRQWEIAKVLTNFAPYDFVIRRPGCTWETVQVKVVQTDRCGSGSQRQVVTLRHMTGSRRRRYAPGSFDLLAAVDLPTDRIWLIPLACLRYQRSNFSLRTAEMFLLKEHEPDLSAIEALTAILRKQQSIP